MDDLLERRTYRASRQRAKDKHESGFHHDLTLARNPRSRFCFLRESISTSPHTHTHAYVYRVRDIDKASRFPSHVTQPQTASGRSFLPIFRLAEIQTEGERGNPHRPVKSAIRRERITYPAAFVPSSLLSSFSFRSAINSTQ